MHNGSLDLVGSADIGGKIGITSFGRNQFSAPLPA
jgi:hypothetical protein